MGRKAYRYAHAPGRCRRATPQRAHLCLWREQRRWAPILLDSLTEITGARSYVRPFESIEEEVSSFYAKVSTPVLANISLDFDGIQVEQMYPQELPDLFAGTQLVLTGRYRDGGPATITLSGEVNGRTQTFTYRDNNFRNSGGDDFIPRLWATRAIGHLLTEIRLRGEDPELVQSVVNLSIRYGIITPYTSYLIEEDDIFSQTGRQGIANGVVEEGERMIEMPAAEEVVAEAAASADMAAAEAPMALPTAMPAPQVTGGTAAAEPVAVNEMIQLVGSKTFVMRDGVWMDTAFNADTQTAQEVGFASDAYFDLLTAVPDLGQYLAIGEQVLVVYEDQVYQIVPGAGDTTITLPELAPANDSGNTMTTVKETAVPAIPNPTNQPASQPTNQPTTNTPFFNWGILIGVLGAALVVVVFVAGKLVGKRP
ncbi:MAG: hypothetical protein H6669_09985 [Ardenticatenaceae bacterium]|nr:hypothetical protein [Ardenticatenaceae bacterium]